MTTDRSYRKARSAAEAVAELRRNSGTQFDPVVVDVLVGIISEGEDLRPQAVVLRPFPEIGATPLPSNGSAVAGQS